MSQSQKSISLRPLSFYEDYSIQNEFISKENNIQKKFERKFKKYNCSKDYLRTTINIFPKREEQIKQTSIPIGLYISLLQFLKKKMISLINYGEENYAPLCRNKKCKAFINPFVKFIKEGKNGNVIFANIQTKLVIIF